MTVNDDEPLNPVTYDIRWIGDGTTGKKPTGKFNTKWIFDTGNLPATPL